MLYKRDPFVLSHIQGFFILLCFVKNILEFALNLSSEFQDFCENWFKYFTNIPLINIIITATNRDGKKIGGFGF